MKRGILTATTLLQKNIVALKKKKKVQQVLLQISLKMIKRYIHCMPI